MPKNHKEIDLDQLFKRAATQFKDDCDQLFEEAVYRLSRRTNLDEDEVRAWLGDLT